jgi:hypothetical protein
MSECMTIKMAEQDGQIVYNVDPHEMPAGSPSLEWLQSAVGGLIEFAPCDENRFAIITCEDGGPHINRLATEIWARNDKYGCVEMGNQAIRGDVVIVGPRIASGDQTTRYKDYPQVIDEMIDEIARLDAA